MKKIKIINCRKQSGYRQEDVARILNIKQNTYSDKELGKIQFTQNEIEKLKEIFKVTYDDLLN